MLSFENIMDAIRTNLGWALAVNVPIAIVSYGAGAVRGSGLLVGLIYGLVIYTFGGYQVYLILLLFFVAGSIASKVGAARKAAVGGSGDQKAARGAASVIGKCSAGAVIAILIGATGGVDGHREFPGLLRLAYTGAFAAALGDTLASELGPLLGKRAILLKTFERVPHGTPGAVSGAGTAFGLAGALFTGILALGLGLIRVDAIAYLLASSLTAISLESMLRARHPGNGFHEKQLPNALLTIVGAIGAVLPMIAVD